VPAERDVEMRNDFVAEHASTERENLEVSMFTLFGRKEYLGHGRFDFLLHIVVLAGTVEFFVVKLGEKERERPVPPASEGLPEYPSHQKILSDEGASIL